MIAGFFSVYDDKARADAYAELGVPGTYYLAFRDVPTILSEHIQGRNAVDFGCGTGRSTRFLRNLGYDVVGVDISPQMLAQARVRDHAAACAETFAQMRGAGFGDDGSGRREPQGRIPSPVRLAATFFFVALLGGSPPVAAQTPVIDLYRESRSFCCKPVDGSHDLDLFKDAANNLIGNACIGGATIDELRMLGVSDLTGRLSRLQAGNLLASRSGRYFLTFPVITGERGAALAAAIRPVAVALAPRVSAIRDQIVKAVPGQERIAFHLLWSRVMDQVFCRAWQQQRRPGDCPPGVDWVVYPASPFTFGTNAWANDFAVTWNLQSRCAITSVVTDARTGLLDAAKGKPYAGPEAEALRRFGLIDPGGRFLGFAYESDGALDSLLDRLTNEYATLVGNRYEYDRLAASLGVPVDQLWVILLHETAYAVFADLDRAGTLHLPPVLTGASDLASCRETVSFQLQR